MKISRHPLRGAATRFAIPLLAVPLLAGCGGTPAGPSSATPPRADCTTFTPDAPCGSFASVGGTTGGKDLTWAAKGAVVVKLESVSGQRMLSVRTPCNPLSGPADVTDGVLTVKELASGAMGCAGENSAQEKWVTDLLHKPVTLKYDAGKLTWSNGEDSLVFAPQS
ncbi:MULTISPECIES: META domain-containing protein [Arthrobacter]|uniref:META domain-containing protein n=2 Tax=Arthrobacter TaxID=1663 RepID=A0ABU9KIL2_9MICC|nr:META domain-containing protein [Arthrobacter sp. YJM1]MDP5227031.1 META domain-containing protein [Arthrobacter sp. YJM1]